jgi:hypothetical protein
MPSAMRFSATDGHIASSGVCHFYGITVTGRLHRFETVLSAVNLIRLRVARGVRQRYGLGTQNRCPYQGNSGERERRIWAPAACIHTADTCSSKASQEYVGQRGRKDVGQTKHGHDYLPDSAKGFSTSSCEQLHIAGGRSWTQRWSRIRGRNPELVEARS